MIFIYLFIYLYIYENLLCVLHNASYRKSYKYTPERVNNLEC